jgi:S-DNA-T family DNA segregation ATPase FtsK/SpoIIIE
VTGLIKANLPSRISYKVGQKVDSKIILDSMGAESLLGRGDMLFTPPGMSGLVRVHAPWSDEKEIENVTEFLKEQREASYDISILKEKIDDSFSQNNKAVDLGELDELFEQAKLVVMQDKKSSISYLQRRLKIGYNRSATIIEQLEMSGILSAPNAKGNREILV